MIAERQTCVFCGERPKEKNREHMLPAWLLELTGDPKRTVTFGIDYARDMREVRFSWNGLVVPACKECNEGYSPLEQDAKRIVQALLRRDGVSARDYITLLDWLDKVRTGLWINYHLVQNHPIEVSPNFYINQRIRQKDRMIAIYPLYRNPDGLNAFGVETPVFAAMPSCFMLRVNDILLLNASTNFVYSHGCGFPHPEEITRLNGGENDGKLLLCGLAYDQRVKSRVSDFGLIKPSVLLFQPIMLPSQETDWNGCYWGLTGMDGFIARHTYPEFPGSGVLFRQWAGRVVPQYDISEVIKFDEITGSDRKPSKEIVAQTYDYQAHLYRRFPLAKGSPLSESQAEYESAMVESTLKYAEFYRSQ